MAVEAVLDDVAEIVRDTGQDHAECYVPSSCQWWAAPEHGV
jgi:hypothetical protein